MPDICFDSDLGMVVFPEEEQLDAFATHEQEFQDIARRKYAANDFELGALIVVKIEDMSSYLESDTLRRQANTVVRLTVVTTFGLIGTVVTGFLGMNLLALAEAPMLERIAYFLIVLIPVTVLTFYTIVKSKRLSDFLEALSDERLPANVKFKTLADVWKRSPRST